MSITNQAHFNRNTHFELRDVAFSKLDIAIGRVDEQVPVARADAAVVFHDFAARVVEGWGSGHVVCECAAVAGCVVCRESGMAM
jgi:hypothetical protein